MSHKTSKHLRCQKVIRTWVVMSDAASEWPTGCCFSLPIVILDQLMAYNILPAIKEKRIKTIKLIIL